MAFPLVEGLIKLEGPINRSRLQNTPFSLPVGFPTDRYAAKWEQKGNAVVESQQPQYIESIGAQAEGWQIYKTLKNPRQTLTEEQLSKLSPKDQLAYKGYVPEWEICERVIRSGTLVLMFRPLALQKALNIVYANQSRTMVGGEIDGDVTPSDPGIMTNRDLRRHFKADGEEDTGYLKPTPIARPTEAAELVV